MKYSELKIGDILYPDNGFDCMEENIPKSVFTDENNEFCVHCKCGTHNLIGQLDYEDNDTIIGFNSEPYK